MLYIYIHTHKIYICIFKSILQKYEILYVNSTKLLKNNLSIKTLASYTWLKARSREITRSPDIVWISLPLQLTSLFSLLKPTFFMAKRETNSPARKQYLLARNPWPLQPIPFCLVSPQTRPTYSRDSEQAWDSGPFPCPLLFAGSLFLILWEMGKREASLRSSRCNYRRPW